MRSFSLARILVTLCLASDALAVPAFARRYAVACTFCHQVFPALNPVGERFKERGFRLANEAQFDRSGWIRSVPFSGRVFATRNIPEDRDSTDVGYLKVLSAGNLGSRLSYWVDDAWHLEGGDTAHIEPDNAWVRLDFKPGGSVYVKGGRFELDLPFTQARTHHLLPYAIYLTSTGLEPDAIGFYQQGIEFGAELGRTRLSAAVVKGRNNEAVVDLARSSGTGNPDRFDGNLFLRASRRMARSRVGAFAYFGRNELVALLTSKRVGVANDNLLRFGADATVRLNRLNLYGVAMYGRNTNSLLSSSTGGGTGESLSFAGGFLSADYYFRDRVALTARVQTRRVELGGAAATNSLTSFLPGLQIVVWKFKFSGQTSLSGREVKAFSSLQVETAF